MLTALKTRISRPLPVGMSEFNTFADRILSQAGNYADVDSMKFALASILIHADASKGSLPDKYFLDRLRKSAANQVSSQVFQDIKLKQAEQQAAEQAAKVAAEQAKQAEELANLRVAESTPPKEVEPANVEKEI